MMYYNSCATIFHALREPERIALLQQLLKGPKSWNSVKKSMTNTYACLTEFQKLGLIHEISESKNKEEFIWEMYDSVKPCVSKILDDFEKFEEKNG